MTLWLYVDNEADESVGGFSVDIITSTLHGKPILMFSRLRFPIGTKRLAGAPSQSHTPSLEDTASWLDLFFLGRRVNIKSVRDMCTCRWRRWPEQPWEQREWRLLLPMGECRLCWDICSWGRTSLTWVLSCLTLGGDMGSLAPDHRIFIASLLAVQLVHVYPAKAWRPELCLLEYGVAAMVPDSLHLCNSLHFKFGLASLDCLDQAIVLIIEVQGGARLILAVQVNVLGLNHVTVPHCHHRDQQNQEKKVHILRFPHWACCRSNWRQQLIWWIRNRLASSSLQHVN